MQEKHKAEDGTNNVIEVCPDCGGTKFQREMREQKFLYGKEGAGAQLVATVPVFTCRACGFEFTGEEAEEARHEAVCRHLHLMTPRRIKAIRERYEMTRGELADLSRIGIASLARWESGILLQNGANDQLLYLLQFEYNVALLRKREIAWTEGVDLPVDASQPVEFSTEGSERLRFFDRPEPRRCPIRGRFRKIDRLDERRSAAAGWRP